MRNGLMKCTRMYTTHASAPLTKTTRLFATHQVPLDCDIYSAAHYPSDGPVFLYFHAGGLVTGARSTVPPWLVQTCHSRQWPLLSASYRLLPQARGPELFADARAAYEFARALDTPSSSRPIIAGGSSAGFLLAALTAHHCTPKPLALLCITGIPTFQHPFFNSSHLISPDEVHHEDIAGMLAEPVSVGTAPAHRPSFALGMLDANGKRNSAFEFHPELGTVSHQQPQNPNRGLLYTHFVRKNIYPALVDRAVDPGFEWARNPNLSKNQRAAWPVTVFIQGDADTDVPMRVCRDAADTLGSGRGVFCLAHGMEHGYEAGRFLEDGEAGMDTVREAVGALDEAVREALVARETLRGK
ncbi:Alpha/Beta hydrolase protein [Mycena galopus ATCC 62051]|nr:Alpha/Beta hydrolase protein [Mycena galopus ATCC 62051]